MQTSRNAALYVQGATQLAGFQTAKSENSKRRTFELFGEDVCYEFLSLAGESFGRLGKEAARFLCNLSEVATYDG